MENTIDTSDISLLYPKGREGAALPSFALSRQNCEALETDVLISLKTCDVGAFFTDDAEVLRYRQQTFADLERHPEICDTLRKTVPILSDISELRRLGGDLSSESDEAQTAIAGIQLYITDHFYECTDEIFAGLGEMYVADERFRKNIDKAGGVGTAEFAREAIRARCGKK